MQNSVNVCYLQFLTDLSMKRYRTLLLLRKLLIVWLLFHQMHSRLEEGQERDGQSGKEGSEAQRTWNQAHRYEDRAERLLLQLLCTTTR